MPFQTNNKINPVAPTFLNRQEEKETPNAWDVFTAAMTTENTIGALLTRESNLPIPMFAEVDPDFDRVSHIEGYEEHAERFAYVNNEEEANALKRQINKENKKRASIEDGGWFGFVASVGAGLVDPINIVPVGGQAYRGYKTGGSILRNAGVTSRTAALSSGVSEVALHSLQETRTVEESAYAIAASTFLGGVLGGASSSLRLLNEKKALAKNTKKAATAPEAGVLNDTVTIGLGDLEAKLKEVSVTQGKGTIVNPGQGGIYRENTGRGGVDLEFKSGLVKVVWQHGAKSDKKPHLQVLDDDITAMPSIFRNFKPSHEKVDDGGSKWTWDIDRKGPDGESRRIRYVVREMTRGGDGESHLVTVHVHDVKSKGQQSQKRSIKEKLFGGNSASDDSPVMDRGTSGIPSEGSPIPTPDAAAHVHSRNIGDIAEEFKGEPFVEDVLLNRGGPVDPMDDLARQVDEDLTIPPEDMPDIRNGDPAYVQKSEDLVKDVGVEAADPDVSEGGSVGAAAVKNTSLADEGLKSALGLEKAIKWQDPMLRTVTSESIETRRTASELAESPLVYEKNKHGLPTAKGGSVETRVKMWNANLAKGIREMETLFIEYRTGQDRKRFDRLKIGVADTLQLTRDFAGVQSQKALAYAGRTDVAPYVNNRQQLNFTEFKEQVSVAMRNGDMHDNPKVEAAARHMRKEVFEPLKKEAVELDLLPEDVGVETADSYLMRVYNVEKIAARRNEFVGIVHKWLKERRDLDGKRAQDLESDLVQTKNDIASKDKAIQSLKGKIARRTTKNDDYKALSKQLKEEQSLIKKLRKQRDEIKKDFEKYEKRGYEGDMELEDTAQQITDRILSTPEGRLPYDHVDDAPRGGGDPNLRGPLKGRSFLIPDNMISSFLENDVEMLGRIYSRTMAADVELTRRFGSVDMIDQIKAIRDDYTMKMRKAGNDEKELTKLRKLRDNDIRDVGAMRDRIRGTYALPRDPDSVWSRSGRVLKNLNYLRLLGGMTLSAIPDMYRTVMVHGITKSMSLGVKPLITNFKSYRLAGDEVRLAGAALDMVLDSRTQALADMLDDYGRHSSLERGLRTAANNFGATSLMAPWNAFWKQFAGTVTMGRMLNSVEDLANGRISQKDLEALAAGGIDDDLARRIYKQFQQHGSEADGLQHANTLNWTDKEAVEAFRAALLRDVDRIIVTPGQDKPLWMSTELGSVIGQFKSFQMASTQRVLLAGLQQRESAFFTGMLGMVGAGMVTYALKQTLAGRDLSDDPTVWIMEGVDRAGVTGWLFEANNMLEKTTRGTVGINALMGNEPMSRYASRNTVGALLGPSFGGAQDLTQVIGSAATSDWRESDTRALRRMLPYQNLFYMRNGLDEFEKGLNDFAGVKR